MLFKSFQQQWGIWRGALTRSTGLLWLLYIAKTDDSTGKVEAATVKEALDNWGISDGIIASCFDTTSSNTGIYSSSTVLLKQHLNRQLIWLSCRHHIPELEDHWTLCCPFLLPKDFLEILGSH